MNSTGLREHQVRIALRCREKPLVAGDAIGAVCDAHRAGGVCAHVRAALLFGHAHADETAALAFDRDVARVVVARDEPRHPVPFQPCVSAHGRNRAVGHGGRAERAAFHLRLHQVARGPRHMRTGNGAAIDPSPWPGVITPRRNAPHQRVPRGMELDPVDALAEYVETMQNRGVAIGETRVLEIFGRGQCGAGVAQFGDGCACALTLHRLPQRRVGREQVVLRERGRLVEHGVRGGGMFHGDAPEEFR